MKAKDYVWLTALGCVMVACGVYTGWHLAPRGPGRDEWAQTRQDLTLYKMRTEHLDAEVQAQARSARIQSLALIELYNHMHGGQPAAQVTQTDHSIEADIERRKQVK